MTMRKGCTLVAAVCIIAAAMLAGKLEASEATAVTCNVMELSPCGGATWFGQKPSAACCSKLREQEPCLCEYMNDPNVKQFADSPNAANISSSCGVPTPTC